MDAMKQLDMLMDSQKTIPHKEIPPQTEPKDIVLSPSGCPYPDPKFAPHIVIDEKTFNSKFLMAVMNKGKTTLSMKYGKGINIITWSDNNGNQWTKLQILDAGCGKQVQKQSEPFSRKKVKQERTVKLDNKGKQGTVSAWG